VYNKQNLLVINIMKNFKKGFTLIELLVVIAIIGLLASVVLASLQNARDKASDAKVKETLSQLRSQSELYYASNSDSWTGLDSNAQVLVLFNSAEAVGAGDGDIEVCDDGSGGSPSPYWQAWVRLKSSTGVWLVDGTGVSEFQAMAANQAPLSCISN
jgi:prepilin-type N-terminal cleavage/methylation domain-containing protein